MKHPILKNWLPLLLCLPGLASAARSDDPLAPLAQCVAAGPFLLLEQQRLPETVTARTVPMSTGMQSVSMEDGYRLLLATPQRLPFLNLKLERSAAASAAQDRVTVEAQMTAFSERRMADQPPLARTSEAGVDTLALHQPGLDRGGVLSFYSFLQPSTGIIATLYVLNQPPEQRAFASFEAYVALRDQAAQRVQACLVSAGR